MIPNALGPCSRRSDDARSRNSCSAAKLLGCLRLVGGQQGAEQAVVELGVEDGHAGAVGGQDVAAGVLDPRDNSRGAEAALDWLLAPYAF